MDAQTLRSRDDVETFVGGVCFKTGPPGAVGIESEWFVFDQHDPKRPVDPCRTQQALQGTTLPAASPITYEPGGQLELSSICQPSVADACTTLRTDLRAAEAALLRAGLRLAAHGSDPSRTPELFRRDPRYASMATYFNNRGPDGLQMMTATASTQVCLNSGSPDQLATRWRRINTLVPLLSAMFANSPVQSGRVTGWCSSRLATWSRMDPLRTSPVVGSEPVAAWTAYALAAPVMAVRSTSRPWRVDPGFTFAEWLTHRVPPTTDDLAFHLSTLFPPVRPQPWLELRCLDALPHRLWPVAVAVVTALLDDADVADLAEDVCQPVRRLHRQAALHGLRHPELARAAGACIGLVDCAMDRLQLDPLTRTQVASFAERYVGRGRSPAHDTLDRLEGVSRAATHSDQQTQEVSA